MFKDPTGFLRLIVIFYSFKKSNNDITTSITIRQTNVFAPIVLTFGKTHNDNTIKGAE